MATRWLAPIAIVMFLLPSASFAQEWEEFESKRDLFAANFPSQPVVTEIVWESEYGARLPARVYTSAQGAKTFSVTAIDYNPIKAILTEKSKSCPEGLERCNGLTSFSGAGYWKTDVRGAMIYAAFKLISRDGMKLTHYMWSFLGGQAVESNELQLLDTKTQTRTFVTMYMHHNRLYVMEATAPVNAPPPGLFVQSMSLKEPDGQEANHERLYFNGPEVDPSETNEFLRSRFPPRQ